MIYYILIISTCCISISSKLCYGILYDVDRHRRQTDPGPLARRMSADDKQWGPHKPTPPPQVEFNST